MLIFNCVYQFQWKWYFTSELYTSKSHNLNLIMIKRTETSQEKDNLWNIWLSLGINVTLRSCHPEEEPHGAWQLGVVWYPEWKPETVGGHLRKINKVSKEHEFLNHVTTTITYNKCNIHCRDIWKRETRNDLHSNYISGKSKCSRLLNRIILFYRWPLFSSVTNFT